MYQKTEEQLVEKFRNKRFPLQTDEATDRSSICHLTSYMRSVEDTTLNEGMLFCKSIKKSNSKRTFQNW
jgi:hypothetical protein